jgi:uncharacterized protein (DUF1330 family)
MSVIVLVQGNPRPEGKEQLAQYQRTARNVIGRHGGEVVARGSTLGKLHGARQWQFAVVLRFPDEASVDAWYNDPEYVQVLPLRERGFAELEINLYQE